jgi:FSR family fosmidomycin resistance protein-like MFS transporter
MGHVTTTMDRRAMSLLSVGHLTDDINQSFIPAMLPFLIISLHLSYTAAGALVLAQAISSSVIQPAIGHLADTRPMPWLICVGLLLAGGGVALMGIAPNYALVFGAALISGIGVACFHPEAGRFANFVAGAKKASGMRWFAVGGNVGFAVGPVFAAVAIGAWGLHGTLVTIVPVSILAVLVFLDLPRLKTFLPKARKAGTSPEFGDDWQSFRTLTAFVILRSACYLGLVAFIPLYAINVLHTTPQLGAALDSTYLVCGIFGTIAGGPLADTYGRRAVLLASTAATTVLVAAFVAVSAGGTLPLWIAFAFAGAIGFAIVSSQASFIVLGQEYLPNRIGVATGVTMGLAVSVGGIFSPIFGRIGDTHGIAASIWTIAALALGSVIVALFLPAQTRRIPFSAAAEPKVAHAS